MKTNCWLILGTMLTTTALAQVNTNKLPEIPAPVISPAAPAAPAPVMAPADTKTNAPAKKAVKAKKKSVKKAKAAVTAKATVKKAPEMPVTLVAGPATVAAEHVNLRGQAGLQGEVVGHVQKGDSVMVLSEITLDKPKAGEPAQWAKISLPTGTKAWVNSKFVDITNNTVAVKKLNLRGGPGENFSVLGVMEKGASITAVTTKGDWIQIEPPSTAFAFVAASYLKQEAGAMPPPVVATAEATPATPMAPPPTPTIPATPTTVPEAPPIAPPATTPPTTPETAATAPTTPGTPVTPPATPETPATTAPTTAGTPPTMLLPPPTLAPEDTSVPAPPRIVTHEGTVRSSISLVAPTYFELYDPTDNKAINYLFSPTTNLNLSRYNGLHITVTGEEGLDPRWKDTPVLTIQKIYVLSDDRPKKHWWSAPSSKTKTVNTPQN